MRHFTKIGEGIDVVPILNALAVRPDLWNENDLRTTFPGSPHSECDDIWLQFNDPTNPESVINDLDVVPYRAWREIPGIASLVLDMMRRVDGMRLGRCMITRLPPGATIPEHTDQGAPATYFSRYHLALQSPPGAINYSGDEAVQYRMGELWQFDNRVPHKIVNNSADDRIVVVMDVRPC